MKFYKLINIAEFSDNTQLEMKRGADISDTISCHLLDSLLSVKVECGFLKATFRLVNPPRSANVENGFLLLA